MEGEGWEERGERRGVRGEGWEERKIKGERRGREKEERMESVEVMRKGHREVVEEESRREKKRGEGRSGEEKERREISANLGTVMYILKSLGTTWQPEHCAKLPAFVWEAWK